nr:uncharacterized protein LOC121502800 [Drosophila kikkawai]
MEKNDDIARGYTKGDRVAVDAKWVELANDLNAAGPPVKDVGGWKKAWADWKTSIKKKLAHNKKESIATGGGPFNQMPLTDMETKIADLCGLFRMVDGIEGARSFGPPEQPIKTEATEESSQKRPVDSSPAIESPAKKIRKTQQFSLEEACSSQMKIMERVVKSLDELNATMRSQNQMMAEHNAAILDIEREKLEAIKKHYNQK